MDDDRRREMAEFIGRSSLGTPAARRLRSLTDPAVVDMVLGHTEPEPPCGHEWGVLDRLGLPAPPARAPRHVLAALSQIERDVLFLRYVAGCSLREVAERLRMPRSVVNWALSAAQRALRSAGLDVDNTQWLVEDGSIMDMISPALSVSEAELRGRR